MEELNELTPKPLDEPAAPEPRGTRIWSILQGAQRYSAYGFTAFATMHAASVLIAPAFGPEVGNSTLSITRGLYQEEFLEPVLVYVPLVTHIAAGSILQIRHNYLYKSRHGSWPTPTKVWRSMSTVAKSGALLTPLILGHIYSMRMAPLNVLGDSSSIKLEWVSHLIHNQTIKMWIIYPMIMSVGTYHIVMGWKKWLGWNGKRSNKIAYGIISSIVLFGVTSFARIARMPPAGKWLTKEYNDVLSSLII